MLSTPEAAKSVFEGESGTLAGVSKGKQIVDCATLTVEGERRHALPLPATCTVFFARMYACSNASTEPMGVLRVVKVQ